jgi:SPP1 gp7 family putative phage head morphogenesis protein
MSQEALESELNELYEHDCCGHDHSQPLADLATPGIEDMMFNMIMDIWKSKKMPEKVNADVTKFYADQFMKGVEDGYGEQLVKIDFESPDFKMLNHLQENVFHFSAAKNYTQLKQLSQSLINDKGQLRTFKEFKEVAHTINNEHVNQWLKTEYELAVASGQMASTWNTIQQNAEAMPLLKFDAVNDNRTTPVCKELDGVVRPVDDTFWKIYYPPNHFNCRSDVQQLSTGKVTPMEKVVTPDNMPSMFKTNLAANGLAFPKDHPYYTGNPHAVKEQADQLLQETKTKKDDKQ